MKRGDVALHGRDRLAPQTHVAGEQRIAPRKIHVAAAANHKKYGILKRQGKRLRLRTRQAHDRAAQQGNAVEDRQASRRGRGQAQRGGVLLFGYYLIHHVDLAGQALARGIEQQTTLGREFAPLFQSLADQDMRVLEPTRHRHYAQARSAAKLDDIDQELSTRRAQLAVAGHAFNASA